MVGRRELHDPMLKHIFDALSIGVQYTLSFQLTNFGLKCLVYVYTESKDVYDLNAWLIKNFENILFM